MNNTDLQILIYGTNLGAYDVELENAQDVELKEIVKPDNKNYVILYLSLKNAEPHTFNVLLKNGKKVVKKVPYELKQRDGRRFRSFDSSDVVYLLMPDRFANGDPKNDCVAGMKEQGCDPKGQKTRHGGDLAGLEQRLDYLSDLGVTAIWTTPILENNMPKESFHGYAITNFYKTDARYGTMDETTATGDLLKLISCLYLEKKVRQRTGRRFGVTDEKLLTTAERMVREELSYALQIPQNRVSAYIAERMGEQTA